jgi:crossover junction endodeoxyribonuclease RuvC
VIALGIDPGVATTGFGVVREDPSGELVALAQGVLQTPKTDPLPKRLLSLRMQLFDLVQAWRPTESAVEALFFAANAKTAMAVGQARGVILLTLHEAGLPIHEYTPLQVKRAIAGYGQADKRQMQEMVKALLRLRDIPKPDDAADALAIAITHIHSSRYNQLSQQ